jgi:hypothetical protein
MLEVYSHGDLYKEWALNELALAWMKPEKPRNSSLTTLLVSTGVYSKNT